MALLPDGSVDLLPDEIRKKLPPLYSTEATPEEDKLVVVKFFNPSGSGTWLAVEFDPEERLFFGYAHIHEWEWGYFSLDELESVRCPPFGLAIERDLYFGPTKFKDLSLNGT